MRGSSGKSRYPRRGAAATEFAAVGLVFFTILLGIVEIGRLLMVQHLATNAARQACRFGVLQGKSSKQISDVAVNTMAAQGISGDVVTVQVNDATADAANAKSQDEITVKVSIPVSAISWLPFTKYAVGSLSAQYTLRRE